MRMPPVSISYALTMGAALLICSLLLRRTQRSLPLSAWEKLGLGMGAFCGAMIGAKLPFVFADWEGMLSGTAWLSHGKTIMCGLVGGYFGVELAKWSLEIHIKTGDTFAAPVALAVAIGRLACFQASCCYGTATNLPWGVAFPAALDDPRLLRHPTQIYESIFHACLALLLWGLGRRGLFRGQLIKLYLLSYLGYRFATEFIRPAARLLGGLTGYQWAALALTPLFAWLWLRDRGQSCIAGRQRGGEEPVP
jgi:phosphatidylglycerol:prolipoprotein diacylglycerol transferase